MKRYLLLRNNRETGPYSLEQLTAAGLQPLDLVWVEGESTSWSHPHEMDGLKHAVAHAPRAAHRSAPAAPHIYIAMPAQRNEGGRKPAPAPAFSEAGGSPAMHPMPELRERTRDMEEAPVWRKPMFPIASIVNVVFVFLGMAGCAFLMKKLVDGLGTGDAVAAQAPAVARPWPGDALPEEKTVRIEPATLPVASAAVEKMPLKPARPSDLRKQVSLTTNKYNVGVFGGINGLELTVSNGSPHWIDKVVVAVSYLKPGGAVVDSASYEVVSLKPRGSRTLALPRSNRGVRVSYRIVRIYSQEYRSAIKQA